MLDFFVFSYKISRKNSILSILNCIKKISQGKRQILTLIMGEMLINERVKIYFRANFIKLHDNMIIQF